MIRKTPWLKSLAFLVVGIAAILVVRHFGGRFAEKDEEVAVPGKESGGSAQPSDGEEGSARATDRAAGVIPRSAGEAAGPEGPRSSSGPGKGGDPADAFLREAVTLTVSRVVVLSATSRGSAAKEGVVEKRSVPDREKGAIRRVVREFMEIPVRL